LASYVLPIREPLSAELADQVLDGVLDDGQHLSRRPESGMEMEMLDESGDV